MSSSSWFLSLPLKGYWETEDRLTGLGLDMESKPPGMMSEETMIYKKAQILQMRHNRIWLISETGKGRGANVRAEKRSRRNSRHAAC